MRTSYDFSPLFRSSVGFDRIFELLAVRAEEGGARLVLAGGAEIRLESPRISCRLKDLGEPWPVFARPSHPLEDDR